MQNWIVIDAAIIVAYGALHTLLTTKLAVKIYNAILPNYTWNIVYSAISVLVLLLGFHYWVPSGVQIYYLTPGSIIFHLSVITLAASLFFFFYCFKYTTSFWQWLGVKQVINKITGKAMPEYYRVRQMGVKKYIRFPHHTCLIVLFWTHPFMTLDSLLLSIGATAYLYLGTYHQDLRGLSVIGTPWQEYRNRTCLLIPGPRTIGIMIKDLFWDKQEENEVNAVPITQLDKAMK